jgi:hypothetical protein
MMMIVAVGSLRRPGFLPTGNLCTPASAAFGRWGRTSRSVRP